MTKKKEQRSNKWAFLIYQDSVPENYLDILEGLHIPYVLSPWHDKDVNKSTGEIKKELVEIKPYNETVERPNSTPEQRQDIAVNKAKWLSAANFCKNNGLTFRIITERTLMPKKIVRK